MDTLKFAVIIQLYHNAVLEYDSEEIDGLVTTAGYTICSHIAQSPQHLNAFSFLGKGKVESIKEYLNAFFHQKQRKVLPIDGTSIMDDELFDLEPPLLTDPKMTDSQIEGDADSETPDLEDELEKSEQVDLFLPDLIKDNRDLTMIFNNRLGNMQILNLQKIWNVKVLDRDGLILEIFEKNARTREAQLQIELARMALETSKAKKEFGRKVSERQGRYFAGKGMVGYAPIIRHFTAHQKKITEELDNIRKNRTLLRKTRSKFFNVGIIGYTNAGKTTLLNSLTKQNHETAPREFTTVSTVSRKVVFPVIDINGNYHQEEIILTDSVGFVYDISPQLIDAFLSTLEELIFSDLLLVVIDLADKNLDRLVNKIETTFKVITQIGALQIPKLIIFNKADLLPPLEIEVRIQRLRAFIQENPYIIISAAQKRNYEELKTMILEFKQKKYQNSRKK